jgi:hypothetical protein
VTDHRAQIMARLNDIAKRNTAALLCQLPRNPDSGPPVGSIVRVSASLKFGDCAMRALRLTRADHLKHRCTRSALRASVTNYSNYCSSSRGRSTGRSSSLANPNPNPPIREHQPRGHYR